MKKIILTISIGLSAFAVLFVASCSKVEEDIKNTTTTAEDITRSETYLGSIFNITEDVASSDGRLNKTGSTLLPSGAAFTFQDSLFTDGDGVEYSLDFGPLPGLLCLDGVTRAGRIDVKQSARYSVVGSIVEVNLPLTNNFNVSTTGGMTKISGKAIVTRLAENKLNFKVQNGKSENAADGVVTFSSDKDIVHQELGAPGIAEDTYTAFGSGQGVNTKGKNYSWSIKDSVVKKELPNCSFPVKGIIELTSEGSTYKIDFAPDASGCDKKVVFTLPNGTKITKNF